MSIGSETIKELETAKAFLAKGLVRNAAGKVFQALKAFLLVENTGAKWEGQPYRSTNVKPQ